MNVLRGSGLLIFLLSSCQPPVPHQVLEAPALPRSQAIFREGDLILFHTGYDSPEAQWFDSERGLLFEGRFQKKTLPAGPYSLSFYWRETWSPSVEFTVLPFLWVPGQEQTFLVTSAGLHLSWPAEGAHASFVFSGEAPGTLTWTDAEESLRFTRNLRRLWTPSPGETRALADQEATRRDFWIADPSSSDGTAYARVTANRVLVNESLEVWVTEPDLPDPAVLAAWFTALETQAFPKVKALWGAGRDVDGNGRISVLMSSRLNGSSVIGFFNPNDFWASEETKGNGMDLLYLGIPNPEGPWAFQAPSLLATFVHEYFHLVSFSRAYEEAGGNADLIKIHETFLEEGLAHLTESLCGYGESGGNMAFVHRFLSAPQDYSLTGLSRDGFSDSVGKRGGVALFLSWLLWSDGGISWSELSPGVLENSAGMTKMRELLEGDSQGLKKIEQVFSTPWAQLMRQWAHWLTTDSVESPVLDPQTQEELQIRPFRPAVELGGHTYDFLGPARWDSLSSSLTILPNSLGWLEPQTALVQAPVISFKGEGQFFLSIHP